MAAISNNDIARAIYLATKDKSHAEQSALLPKVVQFLRRRRLMSKAPEILRSLKSIINQAEGRIEARVLSVEKIDHKLKTHLEHTLKKRYRAQELVLHEVSDQKLLGGIKVEVNDEVIDLSIKNRIEKLQEYLTRPA